MLHSLNCHTAAQLGSWIRRSLPSTREVRERSRAALFPLHVRHISGQRHIPAGREDLIVVCLVRDGAPFLDAFLQHYRTLGAKHVVLLDNGSTDGTVERATREPGVTVLQARVPYRDYKTIAKRYLTRRFGADNWILCVDIDELFDYPYRNRVPLAAFLRYLNAKGFTAVVAHLLDLFPRGVLCSPGVSWQVEHRYYDVSAVIRKPYRVKYGNHNQCSNDRIAVHAGGIRRTHFGVQPMLTKHPLQFPSGGVRYVSSHNVEGARVADISAVLLHYKYAGDFVTYAQRIVREASFYNGSAEYRKYLEALKRNPAHSLYSSQAHELRSVDELIADGFLVVSNAYEAWADAALPHGAASNPNISSRA